MKVTISDPVPINSFYFNVSTHPSWNEGVGDSLRELQDEIKKANTDVKEIQLEKTSLFEEKGIGGFLGYTTYSPSSARPKGDSFYIDLSVVVQPRDAYQHDEEKKGTAELLRALISYMISLEGYTLSKCNNNVGEDPEVLIMRAYFVKDPMPASIV
jgi:hypothetical protein